MMLTRRLVLPGILTLLCTATLAGPAARPPAPANAERVRKAGPPIVPTPDWTAGGTQEQGSFGQAVSSAGDVDGDGYADVAIGQPGFQFAGGLYCDVSVYRGSATGLQTSPSWVLGDGLPGSDFGGALASADVNGDGYSDLIVGAPDSYAVLNEAGSVSVYYGSPVGLPLTPSWTVTGQEENAHIGVAVASAGDVNGDGYDDVLVGADAILGPEVHSGLTVSLFLGSSTGLGAPSAWSASTGKWFDLFGTIIAGAGDVNGDGFDDVIVGAPDADWDEPSSVLIYHGSAAGLGNTPATVLDRELRGSMYGTAVSSAGDVDGDGYDDVLVGTPYDGFYYYDGRAEVYRGSPDGVLAAPSWIVTGDIRDNYVATDYLGWSVAPVGDVDNDGYDDIVVGAPGYDRNRGGVLLFHGSPDGPSATADWIARGPEGPISSFASSIAGAGDVNGDGHPDLVVGASYSDSFTGAAAVYHLGPGAVSDFDGDGLLDGADNCPKTDNALQADADLDGVGDACDLCPAVSDPFQEEYDDDGVGNLCDNCIQNANPLQEDADLDGVGNLCDNCPGAANPRQENSNLDGWPPIGDACVPDDDADGVLDDGDHSGLEEDRPCVGGASAVCDDNCRTQPNPVQEDGDGDGLGDACEPILPAAATVAGTQTFGGFGVALATLDVDGDGHADVLVGEPYYSNSFYNEGRVSLYRGTSSGFEAMPSWVAEGGRRFAQMGWSVASGGDVNGDGHDDVVVGAPYAFNGINIAGAASVYLGGPGGLPVSPSWTAHGIQHAEGFGLRVAGAGDLNGDGYDDVAVTTYRCTTVCGQVEIYFGGPQGLPGAATITLTRAGSDGFSESLAAAGDVNGDGYDDLMVGDPAFQGPPDGTGNYNAAGRAYLYLGSNAGPGPDPDWIFEGPDRSEFAAALAAAGDIDGDGFDDVVVGAPRLSTGDLQDDLWHGRAYLFRGTAAGLEPHPAWSVQGTLAFGLLGLEVTGAGDLDGDGYDDVAVTDYNTEPGNNFNKGRVSIYRGSTVGLSPTPTWIATDTQDRSDFGGALAAGDLTGDGVSDLVVGASASSEPMLAEGRLWAFAGIPADVDLDGVPPGIDNCPLAPNPGQADGDADGVGDACDVCPALSDPEQVDGDGDQVGDLCDNCPDDPDATQVDGDSDGAGDICDVDDGHLLIHRVRTGEVEWQPEVGAEAFNLYRGDLAILKQTGEYTQDPAVVPLAGRYCGLAGALQDDPIVPPVGQAVYYFVTGVSGGVEGSLGTDSAGNPRPNTHSCP